MDLILLDIKILFMSVLYMVGKFIKFHFFATIRTFVCLCHNNKYNTYLTDKHYQMLTDYRRCLSSGKYFSIMVLRYNLSGPKGFLFFLRSYKIRIKISLSPLSFCISSMMDFMRSSLTRL